MKNLIVVIWMVFISASALAAELKLHSYPNAKEIFHSELEESNFLLALGTYKKIDSSWLVDRSQRLNGSLSRTTLELPLDHNAEQGFSFFKDQIDKYNLRELFFCKARDCGTSNSWANNHFKVIQLYGMDQHQLYGAYEITNVEEKPFYVVIYAVLRGNKRAYVQLEVLHLSSVSEAGVASSPESLSKILSINGYFVFPDFLGKTHEGGEQVQIKQAHIQALTALLALQPSLRLLIVGHDYSATSLVEQQSTSLKYADQIKSALVASGVDSKRLQSFGVGSLAPAGRGDKRARVEIVKLVEN